MLNHIEQKKKLQIAKILLKIDYDYELELVPIQPAKSAEHDDCFTNVLKHVKEYGGKAVSGWRITAHPKYVTADFHCVWENEEGNLIDITPYDKAHIKTEILFAGQEKFSWTGEPIDSPIINTSLSQIVDDYILVSDGIFKMRKLYYAENPYDKQLSKDLYESNQALLHLLSQNGTIDSKCPCKSGKAFKDCHRIIINNIKEAAI